MIPPFVEFAHPYNVNKLQSPPLLLLLPHPDHRRRERPSSHWSLQGCQMAKFDPFLSLDCARVEGVGAQSKERKGSHFAA